MHWLRPIKYNLNNCTFAVTGDPNSRPASASATAFEKLRDTAIENLCVALKAGLTVEGNTVMAFISSISSREKAGCDRLPERLIVLSYL